MVTGVNESHERDEVVLGFGRLVKLKNIPDALLKALCRNIHRGNRRGEMFEDKNGLHKCEQLFLELQRRFPKHWLVAANRRSGCCCCEAVGLYRVGDKLFCKKHRIVAVAMLERSNGIRFRSADQYANVKHRERSSFDNYDLNRRSLRNTKRSRK